MLKGEDPDQVKAKYNDLREAYGRASARGYWQQQLEWSKNDQNRPYWLAECYARVGEKEQAIHYLNLAFERTPTVLVVEINQEAGFDRMREDPDFRKLLTKLGLGK